MVPQKFGNGKKSEDFCLKNVRQPIMKIKLINDQIFPYFQSENFLKFLFFWFDHI